MLHFTVGIPSLHCRLTEGEAISVGQSRIGIADRAWPTESCIGQCGQSARQQTVTKYIYSLLAYWLLRYSQSIAIGYIYKDVTQYHSTLVATGTASHRR